MISRVIYAVSILVLAYPTQVFGSVIFSEIMYDLDGSDSNREWVEIFNQNATAVSLSGWKFNENDSNHRLTLIQGDESLASGEYAVIVDDTDTFLIDWPEFSGTLFDSSFSLSNSGETLAIRDSELVDIDSVTYSSEWGAQGDGNTLYYTGSEWSPSTPTPGSGPLSASGSEEQGESQSESNQVENNSSPTSGSNFPVEPQIFAQIIDSAGKNRVVTVGASSLFKGRALGLTGETISGARFLWSFGDGGREEGESILYHYRYPGEYVVVLNVSSGEYSATYRILVSALPAQITITDAGREKIEISNQSDREINLSWWMFKVGNGLFIIPEDTIVLPKKSVIFSSEITKLSPEGVSGVELLYPNGVPVSFEEVSRVHTNLNQPTSQQPQQSIVGKEIPVTIVSGVIQKDTYEEVTVEAGKETEVVNQLASASLSLERGGGKNAMSLLTLIGIIILGSASALFLRRKSRDEITIIE